MNRKTAMKLFGLLGLLMLLSCGYDDRHRNNSSCEQVLVDSLEVRVQDSLFSNVHYSRSQVLDALTQAARFPGLLSFACPLWENILCLFRF